MDETQTTDKRTMENNQKLKYYNGLKEISPAFLQGYLGRMSMRQKIIFYNVLKDHLTEE